jgi:hypothetical protein
MSAKLEEIIGRALSDAQFRQRLNSEPEELLRDYDLNEEELLTLKAALLSEDGSSEATELEQRVNPWVLNS